MIEDFPSLLVAYSTQSSCHYCCVPSDPSAADWLTTDTGGTKAGGILVPVTDLVDVAEER